MGNSGGKKKGAGETTQAPAKQTATKPAEESTKTSKRETPTTPVSKPHEDTSTPKKTDDKSSDKARTKPHTAKDDGSKKIDKFFDAYKDPECEEGDERINAEGIVRLFEDLNVDPEDPTVLVLAYNMQAKEAATFTKSEFEAGCKKLGVDTLDSLRSKWPSFKTVLSTSGTFKEVYKFTFNYMKEDPGHKTVSLDISKAYLALLLSDRPHIQSFIEYLDQQTEYRGLNADQWMTLLDFITNVKEDLSNYDENAAWPVVLDSYVEWKRKKLAEASSPQQ
jgi:hypothetical protein